MNKKSHPPRKALNLLLRFMDLEERENFKEYMDTVYTELLLNKGLRAARIWFWRQLILSLLILLRVKIFGGTAMLRNYFQIAVRNLTRQKVYTILNVLGLAVGIACSILIFLYVHFELSFDRFHKNSDNIFRLINTSSNGKETAITQAPIAPALVEELPEVLSAVRFRHSQRERLLATDEKSFLESNIYWADPEVFQVFDFPLISGNPQRVLEHPYSIVFSEAMAKKYFGDDDPLGRVVHFEGDGFQSKEFTVTGLMRDLPKNSHFEIDFMAPFATNLELCGRDINSWDYQSYYTYLLVSEGTVPTQLEEKINSIVSTLRDGEASLRLQPLTDIHLFSNSRYEISTNGSDIRYIYIFSSIGFLILVIACINYMNLTTALYARRCREVAIRKVVGAQKKQIVGQFFCECFFITSLSLMISLAFIRLFLPIFNKLVERSLSFNFFDHNIIFAFISLLIFTSLFSGSYPAFFVSHFRPETILGNKFNSKAGSSILRNLLVMFQFAVTVMLIISTITIKNQLSYIRNQETADKDEIVVLRIRDREARKNLSVIKNELRRNPNIIYVSSSQHMPNRTNSWIFASWPGQPQGQRYTICENVVDYDFIDLYGLEIAQGRNFSREFPSDANGVYIVNEAAVEYFGFENPIGQEFRGGDSIKSKIVGVVKDFHLHSLHSEIEPLYLLLQPDNDQTYLSVKIREGKIPETLSFLEKQMKNFAPHYPFEYVFYDEIFDKAYRSEQRIADIFSTFSFLAIFIACLGLFGISSYYSERRTKEIGIRKILGADGKKIVLLLSKQFIQWTLFANLVAWPFSYLVMNKWLQNFAYRINLSVWIFLLSGLAAFGIALLTVSYKSIKAATANPVDSLRYE